VFDDQELVAQSARVARPDILSIRSFSQYVIENAGVRRDAARPKDRGTNKSVEIKRRSLITKYY
jgi:hypothetical protein